MSSPATVDELTPAWFSEALGFDIRAVDVVDAHSGTTGRARIRLVSPDGDAPESVFVKLPPFDESQRRLVATTDMGRREARFYAGPGREAPLRIPRSYYAAAGEDPNEYVMVLEDLAASGCTFTSRREPLTEEQVGRLVDGLARLHAHFWDDSRFEDELSWVRPAMRGSYGAKLIASARQQFEHELPPVFGELCRLYVEHHERITELWDEGEQTLIHGDTHAGNQFRDGDQVGLYDWAVISRSPGIRDVAIYLGNSCPTDLRRRHQNAWLRAYHQTLVDAGVGAPSSEVLWERYRRVLLYAWIATTTTAAMGSKWQPVEVGMLGMKRATEACADLDTLGALRDAL